MALLYLGLLVALPLSAVVVKGVAHGFGDLRGAFATPGATAAIRLTILTSLGAAIINGVLGTLIAYVLVTAKIPHWALTSLLIFVVVGFGVFAFALASARRHHRSVLEEAGSVRRLVTMARYGLGVMRAPVPAIQAALLQCAGWTCQLFAVWAAMRAFDIHLPLPAAGLVLVLMNVATIFPLWPGNIGLVQAAVALPLFTYYGVAKANGIAFGFGLQIIEASVGIGVGLIFLAREGLSFAMLKRMPGAEQAEVAQGVDTGEADSVEEPPRARARISG